MGKNFDLIATVGIEINSPISDESSFGNLLIVGPLPAVSPETAPALVGKYTSLKEVTDAGWSITGTGADPVGLAAMVAFSQKHKPSAIYIAPIQVVEETAETAATTVSRALGTDGWYAVCTAGVAENEYSAIASLIETQDKVFIYTETSFFTGSTPKVGNTYYRTIPVFGKENSAQAESSIPVSNKYINVAFAAMWLGYEPGSETTAFKELAGVNPAELTSTEQGSLADKCVTYLATVGNKNITIGGKVTAGEWADVIRFRDWLKNDMQTRVVNLFATRAKIPFTDAGVSLIQNQMIASLKAGQVVGGIAEDEFDADGNMIPGFTTSVPLVSSISAAERSARHLSGCTFTARLAGAIHFAEISGNLTYEM